MIDKGSYIRKKSWGFFSRFYLSGKAEYLPAIEIISIVGCGHNLVVIDAAKYHIDDLVEITKEEHDLLVDEFKKMSLVDSLNDGNHHIRKDNGEIKIAQKKDYALRYCFTFNHKEKNNGIKMSAYICSTCSQIHCGSSLL